MESFDDVHDALRDVINNPPEPTADDDGLQTPDAHGLDDGKKPALDPRVQAWTEPTPFSYDNYQNKEFTNWAGMAARYEWNDDYGDIGPRNEELEKQLFNMEFMPRAGVRFDDLKKPDEAATSVKVISKVPLQPIQTFKDAGLHPVLLQNLEHCLYNWPTAIQCYTIPAIHEQLDVIGVAQTGSGKTGAFLIPILSKLMGKVRKLAAPRPNIAEGWDPQANTVCAEPLVLIMCPTRELATQIFDDARRLCYRSMLRPCVVYGGAPARLQREELQKGCDILVGTPGRLMDFIRQPNVLSLRRIRYTVVDEADELLQADWEEDFKLLMGGGDLNADSNHRYMMFSASFNKECRKLARDYLSEDVARIEVSRPGSAVPHIKQTIHWVDGHKKKQALHDLILSLHPTRTLVFVNSKQEVDFVDDYLFNQGLPTTSMHGDRTQREREDAIRAFRTAKCPIMITTGVSARGLDIINVMHVVNYDLPRAAQGGITEYMHRIGRTARIGNEGLATSFYNERDEELASDLVKLLIESGQDIPDFLQEFQPTEATLRFDDDTTDSEAENADEPQFSTFAAASENEDEPDANDEDGDEPWGQAAATTEPTDDFRADDVPGEGESTWRRQNINKDEIDW